MNSAELKKLLSGIASGKLNVDEALDKLRHLPYEDLGFARVDHHRSLRQGMPEVILGEGKTAGQVASIVEAMDRVKSNILVTRATKEQAQAVRKIIRRTKYDPLSRTIVKQQKGQKNPADQPAKLLVISAGTSDLPVAEEAVVTARFMGLSTDTLYDVGVAGIHRLLDRRDVLDKASVVIVVAGMEGALASVVGGLIKQPIIAVPTSVGYGANFGGVAALLGMLNSCASGVSVVNIDNGFGAACAAVRIIRGL